MRFNISLLLSIILLWSANIVFANNIELSPKNWWQNMHLNKVTVIAEKVPLGLKNITINYPGVSLINFSAAQNNTFYYLELEINTDAKAGAIPVTFHLANNKSSSSVFYLYERTKLQRPSSLTAADVIYQIIPDRFCDGQPANNQIKDYLESYDPLNPGGLHGGDIKGIINNIHYLSELGCTSIELTPVLESNLITHSYDRMGPTNHYKIDERLGDYSDYSSLIEKCSNNHIKLIQSFVLHQIGKQHPWYKKMIDADFFYQTLYNYEDGIINLNILLDPYSTEKTKANNRKTWERPGLPTLNQNNPLVQTLLIQHCIWWLETSGIRLIKIEQTARNTPGFLSLFIKALRQEYPSMSLIFDTKSIHNTSSLEPTVQTDMHSYYTDYSYPQLMSNVFSTYKNENEGVKDLYHYAIKQHPKTAIHSKIICLDNYSLTRAFTNADSESSQLLLMLGHLLTSPGIPSIYYGTEWQLKGNYAKGESDVRKDFPEGRWDKDKQSGFTTNQMSNDKIKLYHQLEAILTWRRNNPEILNGDFIHFYPENDTYTFARLSKNGAILVIINNSGQKAHQLNAKRYEEILSRYISGVNIITGDRYVDYNEIITPAKSITILELHKDKI